MAEDSLVVRAVLRRHLEQQGCTVVEASDGESALAACEAEDPDVVLLDIEMPGLDGHQVLTALKRDPKLRDLPVVFLSGRTSTEDVVAGLALGAHDYLKKPFEPSELIARVSSAVRLKRVQDELRSRNVELDLISRTDPLTGLFNRRHLDERIQELASTSARLGVQVAVVMFDIDFFKRINDSVGHAGGDAVLKEFSCRVVAQIPADAIAGRWGGEEFLVFLPDTDDERALEVANRVRLDVADRPFSVDGGDSLPVTVSGGCATSDGTDPEGLVRMADAALYVAKESGRNRIIPSHEPTSGAIPQPG
ncbi:MAG: diguanylate cyclase [Actinobacteria bacterium]|nr:diguanylate cyclase [Actinomycetota bacterium]